MSITVLVTLVVVGVVAGGIGYLVGYRAGYEDSTLELALEEEWADFRRERREAFAQVAQEFAQEHGELGVVVGLHGADLSVEEYVGGTEAPVYTGMRTFKPWWGVFSAYRTQQAA